MTPGVAQVLAAGQSEQVEFKGPRVPVDSVAREVCGFLNQQGGTVIWGVDDRGKPAGIADVHQRARALIEHLGARLNPQALVSVTVEELRHAQPVVVVDVPAGADKPYSLSREIWVRVGARTLRATADNSAEIVRRAAAAPDRWERSIMPGFDVGDCDREELDAAGRDIEKTGRFGVAVPRDHDELLRRLYLVQHGQLTNAAVVLFARDPLAWTPDLSVRVVSYAGDASDIPESDHMVTGPAIRVLREAVGIIQQRTGFSSRLRPGALVRADRPAYAVFALREGLVNALVHRDYAALGGRVRVDIRPDRLTISNPGRLPEGWSPAILKKRHDSLPVNPDIARVFYLRGLMEQLGRGTLALIAACRELGARTPDWKVRAGLVSLTLHRAPRPDSIEELGERERGFLNTVAPETGFTAGQYMTAASVSLRQARRDLADMTRLGVIERIGRGRTTSYRRVIGRRE
jgi:ATP-dependent DNA helicase RecG